MSQAVEVAKLTAVVCATVMCASGPFQVQEVCDAMVEEVTVTTGVMQE